MIAFPRYESYRDSGADWLGQIPEHWALMKTKFLWKEHEDRSVNGEEQLLSVSQYSGITTKDDESRSESLVDYKKCRAEDLVVNIMLAWMGGLGVTDHDGIVSPAYCVYRQIGNHNPKYLNYLYKTPMYLAEFARRSKGVVPSRWRMYTEDFGQVLSLLPPRDEQDCIANFLDQKTAEIDEAIAKKQRLIELLKEQKAILINRAVTKGLNPDVPMRDSGVEWIGEVPAHWKSKRAKYLFKEVDERSQTGTEELLSVSHMTGVTPRSEKNVYMFMAEDYSGSKLCMKDDLVFNIMWAWMGALGVSDRTGIVSPSYGVYRQRFDGCFNSWYLESLLRSRQYVAEYNRRSTGLTSSRLRLYSHMFFDMKLGFPPREEQDQIEKEVTAKTAEVEKAVLAVESEIEKLNEFRNVLISEAVTGKIKI